MRGNLTSVEPERNGEVLGSIPARAGEPEGVAVIVVPNGQRIPGLSPRVRGNLVGLAEASAKDGSIPARAGEPLVFHQ